MITENLRRDDAYALSIGELRFGLTRVEKINDLEEGASWLSPADPNTYLLVSTKRDNVQFAINGQMLSLNRGAFLFGLPGQQVEYLGGRQDEAEVGYALLFEKYGNQLEQDELVRILSTDNANGPVSNDCPTFVLDLCDSVYRHWHAPSSLERLRGQAAFYELMYNLLSELVSSKEQGIHSALDMIRAYLDANFEENISIESLAERIGVSSRHFRRSFKERYGVSATDYVTELRMSRAKRLMEASVQPIGEIARHVGYHDESHFRRMFKQQMGFSPSIYLKNRQLKVAACSFPNIGQLLPLNVIPFAAPIDHDWTDYYRRKFHTDVQFPLRHNNEINRKMLQAARPDRIIAIDAYGSAEFQQGLGEIAPVLVIPWRTRNWREHLLLTASFLDKTEEAVNWLAAYDEKVDRVCELMGRISRWEEMDILLIDRHDCYRFSGSTDPVSWSRRRLPFAPARHNAAIDPAFVKLTTMESDFSDAGRIMVMLSEDRQSRLTWSALQQSPSWKKRKAVRHSRIHTVLAGPWFEYTAYNHGAILDQVLRAIKAFS
ncbi:AraC family transcriptional regulator [Paenibacillus filicis]|uniref:AraC family transcriptional regulator n=1 Tax=Paenibacillus filicis TaxID=669464 RepID=A0ABU9DG54_9BACL